VKEDTFLSFAFYGSATSEGRELKVTQALISIEVNHRFYLVSPFILTPIFFTRIFGVFFHPSRP